MTLQSEFLPDNVSPFQTFILHPAFTVTHEKSKMFSFASSIMKNIVVFPAQFRFPDLLH